MLGYDDGISSMLISVWRGTRSRRLRGDNDDDAPRAMRPRVVAGMPGCVFGFFSGVFTQKFDVRVELGRVT